MEALHILACRVNSSVAAYSYYFTGADSPRGSGFGAVVR